MKGKAVRNNGIRVVLVTQDVIDNLQFVDADDFTYVGDGYYYGTILSVDDVLTFAGYSTRQIDYAYPLQWAINYCEEEDIKRSELPRVFWSYESGIFGSPLWWSDVIEKAYQIMLQKIDQGDYEDYVI